MDDYDRRHVCEDDVACVADTVAAVLVELDGEDVWIPRSQLHDDNEVNAKGDTGKLVMTRWIAEQKGLV